MRIVVTAAILTAVLGSSLWAGGVSALDGRIWHQELQKAHVVAKSEGKPMLIVFGATWCKFCTKLEKETLSDPQMQTYIQENFVPVHLDLDEQKAVGKILEVKSLPCTVVLSPNADLLGKIVGYKEIPEMKEELEKALQTQNVLKQASQGEKVVR